MALHSPKFEIILMTKTTVINNQCIKAVLELYCGDNVQFCESGRKNEPSIVFS